MNKAEPKLRWAVFTPVSFVGSEDGFFTRDTGLLCRTLQKLGYDAKVVMPLPRHPEDADDILRVPSADLKSSNVWKTLGVDAVLSYSWGDPKYTKAVEAIKAAGLKLFVNLDTDGLISPFVEPKEYLSLEWLVHRGRYGVFRGAVRFLLKMGWQIAGLHSHFSRLRHLDAADAVGVVSPLAADRIKKYVRFFGRTDIAKKIHFVPHPVDPVMRYDGRSKLPQVVAVGRWTDAVQKRPTLLMDVVVRVLSTDEKVRFVIVGAGSSSVVERVQQRAPQFNGRILGHERLTHPELCELLSDSQIALCTSSHESFHIASGEALLCGCTIVAPQSATLPSFQFFVEGGVSGRLSVDHPEELADAVLKELSVWRSELRNGENIAQVWRKRIGAHAVIESVMTLG